MANLDPKVWGPKFWFFLHTISLTYPNYKNSACLLISYYCLDKNKNILEDKLKKVEKNILKNEKDFKIEDIIRYSRLWKNINQ